MHARFLQIHTLTHYPASLLNRDDAGFAKRMPFGGAVRWAASTWFGDTLNALSQMLPDSLRSQDQLRREREILARGSEFQGPFASRMLSFEGYGEALQLAATNQTQLESNNLLAQLRNYLEAHGQILERIESNTADIRNLGPAWR